MATITGISTLGIKLAQAEYSDVNTIPNSFAYLERINSIGSVEVTPETIDASALEDSETKNIAGRSSVSDTLEIVVNYTSETVDAWSSLLGKKICFQVIIPNETKSFYTFCEVPSAIPQPSIDQNGLLTFTMNCTVNNFKGLANAKVPTTSV